MESVCQPAARAPRPADRPGLEIALFLVHEGATVIGIYHSNKDAADRLHKTLGNHFVPVQADITKAESAVPSVVSAIEKAGIKKLDIIVNNAALSPLGPLSTLEARTFLEVLEANVVFPAMVVKALLPILSKSGTARIINISSEGAHLGRANTTAYSASKAALESMTRTWAQEFGREYHGLTSNALALGMIETDLWERLPSDRKHFWNEKLKETPVSARLGKPNDVAGLVAFLAGDQASWVSGQVIAVGGGNLMK